MIFGFPACIDRLWHNLSRISDLCYGSNSRRFHQYIHLVDQVRFFIHIPSYLSPSVVFSLRSLRSFLMSPPSSPALQQLNRLERASPDFHDQLYSVLYGEEYVQCEQTLEGDDLMWLIEYLNKVCCHVTPLHSPLKHV